MAWLDSRLRAVPTGSSLPRSDRVRPTLPRDCREASEAQGQAPMPAATFVETGANRGVARNKPIGDKSIEHPHLFLGRQIASLQLARQRFLGSAACGRFETDPAVQNARRGRVHRELQVSVAVPAQRFGILLAELRSLVLT